MSTPLRRPSTADQPISLHERAMEDLRFIRETMERTASFTAVPGWGGVALGLVGVAAAPVAQRQASGTAWLVVWLATAAVAALIASGTMVLKARRANMALSSGPGRKFLLSFLPPVAAAIALTAALHVRGEHALMPGMWLLSYGAAIITAGTFSVRIVPLMGVVFMLLGGVALGLPQFGDVWMAAGFGGLHIVFGFVIAREHGG